MGGPQAARGPTRHPAPPQSRVESPRKGLRKETPFTQVRNPLVLHGAYTSDSALRALGILGGPHPPPEGSPSHVHPGDRNGQLPGAGLACPQPAAFPGLSTRLAGAPAGGGRRDGGREEGRKESLGVAYKNNGNLKSLICKTLTYVTVSITQDHCFLLHW